MRLNYFYNKIIRSYKSGTLTNRVIQFIWIRIRTYFLVLKEYYGLSESYRNLNLVDGFKDHRNKKYHHQSNQEHIQRIINAYKESKKHQLSASKAFAVEGLWDEWIDVNYQYLINALETENISKLSSIFENLFRESCTIGTGGYDNWIRYQSLFGKLYLKSVWSNYEKKLLSLPIGKNDLIFPNVGNPAGVLKNGNIISIETLRHAYHAVSIKQLFQNRKDLICVEIGGGLGGQGYQTMNICNNNISRYLLFDIPEVATLSSYMMLSAFPNKKIRLFGEGPISVSDNNYDIGIFPHYSISELRELSVDLFYNSCSFSEMDEKSSTEYLSVINKCCRKYFMHDNHDKTFIFKNNDGTESKNIIGSDLVPDKSKFKRIYKKPRVHGLPEDKSYIHHEFLYERI